MAKTLNLYAAKTSLSELVDLASAGEEFIIAKAGKPKARLIPLEKKQKPRKPANALGLTHIADDFDAPLPARILKDFGY
jgi:prevent-host-death family protein